MSNFAWVTLTTNDTYSLGALVLAYSLRRTGTAHQLAVLVTPRVSEAMRHRLKDVYNIVQEVNVMDSQDAANLALLARPELGVTFTKLHCWRLVQFEKCVFLDADILVLQNSDELFEREEFSAAPDVSWPDCFNSGVFVYRPSLDTFTKIIEFAIQNGSFDGGDQGLLNQYFANWATTNINKRLPFVYNVTAYAAYCYLPAFRQFRDKIKILHFAGKLKPWLIQFNSESRIVSTPTEYAHAHDLIQLWWDIFCDNVHQLLSDNMKKNRKQCHFMLIISRSHYDHYTQQQQQKQQEEQLREHHQHYEQKKKIGCGNLNNFHQQQQQQLEEIHMSKYRDPWVLYYDKIEAQKKIEQQQQQEHEQRKQQQEKEQEHQQQHIGQEEQHNEYNSYDEIMPCEIVSERQTHFGQWTSVTNVIAPCTVNIVTKSNVGTAATKEEEKNKNFGITATATIATTTTATKTVNNFEVTIDLNNNKLNESEIYSHLTNEHRLQSQEEFHIEAKHEVGLAGALSQLRLGAQRTCEQEAYENLMRRQCWESGQIDYTGRDSFANIWSKISETLESKSSSKNSELITSADIEDGKVERNPKTGATTVYKVIQGGYEVITKTPEPDGTIKTQVRTFWDPKPISESDMAREVENKKVIKQRLDKEIRIDKNTIMLTRAIEGGYEEVYTITNDDGTKSVRTKTFYDSVPTETNQGTKTTSNKNRKTVTRKSSVDSTDSTESRRVVQKVQQQKNVVENISDQQTSYREQSTIEETCRVTQNIEVTENNRTVRKNSLQEQSHKAIKQSSVDGGKKKKKLKSSAPPPPVDFLQNDTTTVTSKRIPGGTEFLYTTELESGKTVTTSKTVYEEEEVELTEEEIKAYKKTLKDAEKHKNITTTKKLKSESGTKKVVPSENPGDVTTLETIKIDGGTEYHYITVTAEGIVKKSVKTVYDPVPSLKNNPDDTDEEEIIEEYEEEVIEPGEKNVRTIETVKQLPQKFEEEVTITHEKNERKVKKSMVISA